MPDITASYNWAINTCNAPNVGYSQQYRNQKTVNGVTYYDCSSFIWYALLAGGFPCVASYNATQGENYSGNAIRTGNGTWGEVPWLLHMGFTEVPISGEWMPGDIVWREGHTEMVHTGGTGRGICMGAHQHFAGNLQKDVSISTYYSTSSNFTRIFRWGSGGVGTSVSLYVIAAIIGNMSVESTCNPGLWETPSSGTGSFHDLNRGFGLGQWTNTGGDTNGRLWKMYQWLAENGYQADDGYGQLMYILHEDNWLANPPASDFPNLSAFLASTSTDLAYLTECWKTGWEGLVQGAGNLQERIDRAQAAYTWLLSHGNDTLGPWISENRYLSLTSDEYWNNVLNIYRFFASGGGGGPTPIRKGKMPVWMMLRPPIYI